VLPDAGELPMKGLTIIIGPNSSGKTQMLEDIYCALSATGRELVVCESVCRQKPDDFNEFIGELETSGVLKRRESADHGERLTPWTARAAGFKSFERTSSELLAVFHRSHLGSSTGAKVEPDEFCAAFGYAWLRRLSLTERLLLARACGSIDFGQAAPENIVQTLRVNDAAQRELTDALREVFGWAVWLDVSRGMKLCFRVNPTGKLPSAEDRLSFEKMDRFRVLDEEGDGLKSYAGICMELLCRRQAVCLIDEPEMCLHPPQAYALGRFVGRHATDLAQSTVIATHSAHFLRGVVQATHQLQIIRLTRKADMFRATQVDADKLRRCIERPAARAERVLDGLFAPSVVIVEGEGDRLVYRSVLEKLSEEGNLTEPATDLHFVPVGGTGGIAKTLSVYRSLNVPASVIADLDLISDSGTLKKIVRTLVDSTAAEDILLKCSAAANKIRACAPAILKGDVVSRLQGIADSIAEWNLDEAKRIHRDVSGLRNELSSWMRLRRGGIESFAAYADIHLLLSDVIARCAAIGLFLVPVGCLEFWISDLIGAEERPRGKDAWAVLAAEKIQDAPCRDDNIWAFLRQVAQYCS